MSAPRQPGTASSRALWAKLAPLAYLPVFLLWYFALEGRPSEGMFVVDSTFDALIPFDARWALGYFAWFPFLLGFIGWLLVRDFRSYAETPRLAFLLIVGMTACLIGYTLWPTTQTLRPQAYPDQGWFTGIVAGLQGFDLLAGHEIALHHVHPVGFDDVGDAAAGAIQTAATGQGGHAGTDQHNQAQTGAVTGLDGHG